VIGRRGWQVTLPGGPLTLLQIAIGIIDLGFCALAMYMLVPDEPNIGFATLAVIFVSATLLGLFAGLAFALALIGLNGVISYLVAQRTHEIGVRMALGARPAGVLRLVLAQALGMAAAGVVTGLIVAFFATRLLANQLYGVEPVDPTTFLAVPTMLTAAALAASSIPALRATRVDPLVALRYE